MIRSFLVSPRDPLMFRDGRSFDAGLSARSIPWPLPATIAGFIRTRLWGSRKFDVEAQNRLRSVVHFGPFLACHHEGKGWDLAFPAPADAAAYSLAARRLEIVPLRPARALDGGCDLPEVAGRRLSQLEGLRDQKVALDSPPFWSAGQTLAWLRQPDSQPWYKTSNELGVPAFPEQVRMHTEIGPAGRNVRERMLFRTRSLEIDYDPDFHSTPPHPIRQAHRGRARPPSSFGIFSRVEADGDDWSDTNGLAPFSGEQRLAFWSTIDDLIPPIPEAELGSHIRVQLVTPGKFLGGWKPGWVESGEPPGCPELKLRLISAAVSRFVPVSGFDLTKSGHDAFRATQFLAPAGSVYFFEVEKGDPRQLWFRSISDHDQARLDGFGIAILGGWQWR